MEKIKIYTGVTNGRPHDQEGIDNAYKYFEGVGLDITFEKHSSKRTNPQNNWLWGIAWTKIQKFLEQTTGKRFSLQEIHDHYKSKGYFGFKTSPITNDDIPKGSSEANTFEFSQAKERIQREWAIKGLIIEDPNQTEFLSED
jgi:hypothetical protein